MGLSRILQVTMVDSQAFDKAVKNGYIEVRGDGTLVWMLKSHTLLAYFCGRLWSGDYGIYSRRKKAMLWQMGKKAFPGTELGRAFGVDSLKQARNRRKNRVVPEHSELIDFLFDSNV